MSEEKEDVFLDYRVESRDAWGWVKNDDDDDIDDDRVRLGAILRIADALEKMADSGPHEQVNVKYDSRVAAMRKYMMSLGFDPYWSLNAIGIPETICNKLSDGCVFICIEDIAELVGADEVTVKYRCNLTDKEIEKVRERLAVYGWCLHWE